MHFYGITIALAILASFLLAKKRAKLFKIPSEEVENIYLLLIPFCLFGARIYHIFHQWQYYSSNPKEIIVVWQGGLGIYGAIIGGIIALFIYSKVKGLSFLTIFDFLSPSIALTQAIGRLANFFNQEVFGPPTNLSWKVYISLENRPFFWQQYSYFHPLFLYESLFMLFGCLLLLFLGSKFPKREGLISGAYFILYGSVRFLTEFGRFDTWQISGFKLAQILSIFSVIGGTYLIRRSFKVPGSI